MALEYVRRLPMLAMLAALAAGMGSPALAAEANWPTKSDWARKPNGNDMAEYYPKKAQRDEAPGRAIIDCDVTAKGLLENCQSVEEWPADQGFGEAAVKLSKIFRLDPKAVDLGDPKRNRAIIPIIFAAPGKPLPPSGFLAGQNAMSVTLDVKPGGKTVRACATTAQPDRHCAVHALDWEELPWLAATLPALRDVDMTSSTSVLQCAVSKQSRLIDCEASSNATPAARKAMLAIADQLVAPERAKDGARVGAGPLLIPFDWSQITPLARKLKRP